MSSQTDICNQALAHFGQSRITDISQTTGNGAVPAEACREFWDTARKSTLRAAPWNFCGERASLTASATAPLFHWQFAYPLPSDFMRLVSVNRVLAGTKLTNWVVEGQSLLTNQSKAEIVYVKDVPLTGTWPEDFVSCFSFKLAALVAPRLMADGGNTSVVMLNQFFQNLLPALGTDQAESKPTVVRACEGSEYLAARCAPSPGDWYPCGPGLPATYGEPWSPYNVSP